ncbi:sensor histidine kinase [Sporomusa aerivorans]|uniref:sensor histidine kinase n=1 Tax=Sporomusa aerivorans TaxID=204936 RepID=UPI00352B57BD
MWLKIKQLAIPISVKLAILYAVILFCILLFTSLITVAGLCYMLYAQADNSLDRSAATITHYLETENAVDQYLLRKKLLPMGIILRIVDNQNNLIFDNAPFNADTLAFSEEPANDIGTFLLASLNRKTQVVSIESHYFYYANQVVTIDKRPYLLHFFKPMTEQAHFLVFLIKILLITNALGLLIAIVSGVFISRKILRPLRDVINTAREIEVNDLGKRIEITGSNDELQELAKTFNHMLNRIQTGFEQQRRFVSDASHELRTPITVISGYTNMLDRWGKQDPAALEEGIAAIKSEAANMYKLIEKLLFLARADHNKQIIAKVPVATEPLIDGIAQETCLIAPSHQIVLAHNDSATIHADASSIKEMLRIFIENSIKYTPAGQTIRIASHKADGYLEITVQDTGIGIPEEDLPHIFDRFYRADKSRTKAAGGGTGLGLSIARWIAVQHDSTIDLTSKPGGGTTVVVKIPLLTPILTIHDTTQ